MEEGKKTIRELQRKTPSIGGTEEGKGEKKEEKGGRRPKGEERIYFPNGD